jgi:prepilin-type processing-associated H-X9-DG protein
VPWSKPDDLPYAADRPLPGLGGLRLKGGFMAAFADGSVRSIPEGVREEALRAAITRDGGESLGPDWRRPCPV